MTSPQPPALEQRLRLSDGRQLGYAAFGDPSAEVTIFWLHGTPGARRQIPLDARAHAETHGVRIIGIDRPGVGWSTQHVYDNVRGFSADLEQLADELGIDTFHVVGLSGGGPYTLGAGAALPDRVISLGVIGGVAPTVGDDAAEGGMVAITRSAAPFLTLARRPLGFGLSTFIRLATPFAGHAIDLYRVLQPSGDRRLLKEPDFRAMFVDDLTNGAKEQCSAILTDLLLFSRDWGFSLDDVKVPVRWWHGRDDHIVPFRHGEHVVSRLPDAQIFPLEGEAHLGGLGIARDIVGGFVPGAELIDGVITAED